MEGERTKVKRRKRSPRPTRYRGRLKKPGVAEAQKKLWADPEYRAKMMEKRRLAGEARRGFSGRLGVPDGMRKAEADKLNAQAAESAKQTMADLKQAGVVVGIDAAGEEAMLMTLQIMRAPGDKKVRLAAAKQILEWTRAKPATQSNVTVNAAEEWLKAVAAEEKNEPDRSTEEAV